MASHSITWSGRRAQHWIKRYRNLRIVFLPVLGVSDANSVRVMPAMAVGARRFGSTYTDAVMASRQYKWRDTGIELLSRLSGFGIRKRWAMTRIRVTRHAVQLTSLLGRSSLPASNYTWSPTTVSSSAQNQAGTREPIAARPLSNNVVNVTRSLAIASRLGGIHICTPRMRYLSTMGGLFRIPRLPLEFGGA